MNVCEFENLEHGCLCCMYVCEFVCRGGSPQTVSFGMWLCERKCVSVSVCAHMLQLCCFLARGGHRAGYVCFSDNVAVQVAGCEKREGLPERNEVTGRPDAPRMR